MKDKGISYIELGITIVTFIGGFMLFYSQIVSNQAVTNNKIDTLTASFEKVAQDTEKNTTNIATIAAKTNVNIQQ